MTEPLRATLHECVTQAQHGRSPLRHLPLFVEMVSEVLPKLSPEAMNRVESALRGMHQRHQTLLPPSLSLPLLESDPLPESVLVVFTEVPELLTRCYETHGAAGFLAHLLPASSIRNRVIEVSV